MITISRTIPTTGMHFTSKRGYEGAVNSSPRDGR